MTKALVLSGGGSVGIAWQTGLATGLARHGVRLGDADLIVGTSAGSAVGAQLAIDVDLEERLRRYEQPASERTSGAARTAVEGAQRSATGDRMATLMKLMSAAGDEATPEERRAAIGRYALEADALPEEAFVAGYAYLADKEWPARFVCTGVDAETGEFVAWDVKSGVPLDRAVAASCAVPGIFSPITINGRRYMDGGMRSGSNADLAKGYGVVLLVTLMRAQTSAAPPTPEAAARAERYRRRVEAERKVLEESGTRVELIAPDVGTSDAMGMNLMDASRAPGAARQGVRQGEAEADRIAAFWTS